MTAVSYCCLRRAGIALAGLLLLGACSVPQQLLLPDPPKSQSSSELTSANRGRPGVSLGEAPDPGTRDPSFMRGTGHLIGTPNPRPQQTSRAGETLTIDLSQASVSAAAKAVLGDILGVEYTVSDKVTGTITLQTPQPVSRARLLEMFEAALLGQGAAIVTSEGIYRVLPMDEALAAGGRIQARGARGREVVGVTTEIVQLRNISAPDMERLLKTVAPQSAAVRIDPQRNLLIITGTRSDLAALHDAVSVFDVDWMRGMSFAIFPIESADPEALVQELDNVFANNGDGSSRGIVRFIPNRRLKAVLVVSAKIEHLRRAEQWIRKLDAVGRATEKQVHVYHVKNRAAAELAVLLQKVYVSQDGTRVARITSQSQTFREAVGPSTAIGAPGGENGPSSVAAVGQRAAVSAIIPGLPVLPPSPIAPASGDNPAASAGPGMETASIRPGDALDRDDRATGIGIVADQSNNSLVITATASEFRRIRQILARLDVAPAQVLLEATIAEVTLNDELKLGMRWYFQTKQNEFRFTDSALGAISPVFPGFSYFLNKVDIQVALNTLATITNVNIVSTPSLMVVDNKKAILQVGAEVPVATQSAVAIQFPGAPVVNSVSFRNTGIILSITPRISERGRVLLDIEQEASDVVRTTTSNIDSPTIQQRRVQTTVTVADGESIVLAGLIQDKATRERGQIPIVGDIPLLGNVFKNKTDTIERTELLIAITPRIVNDQQTVRSIVDEFRGKLNFNTRPQRDGLPDRHEQRDRIQR